MTHKREATKKPNVFHERLFPIVRKPPLVHSIKVSKLHTLCAREYGNPNGYPVVVLHGGPGLGCTDFDYRFFDPDFFRIILLDQRGAGASTPHAELRNNTTKHLLKDLETVRKKLEIKQWLVFGGSWGSTLALLYAEKHPKKVSGLILRGTWLGRAKDIRWYYQDGLKGAGRFYPRQWKAFKDYIPKKERKNLIKAYYRRVTSKDRAVVERAAKSLVRFAFGIATLDPKQVEIGGAESLKNAIALARINFHYLTNKLFMEENQILKNINRIRKHNISTWIIHGRFDMVCTRDNTDELCKHLPNAEKIIVSDAGHSKSEPGISKYLVAATEEFKDLVRNESQAT